MTENELVTGSVIVGCINNKSLLLYIGMSVRLSFGQPLDVRIHSVLKQLTNVTAGSVLFPRFVDVESLCTRYHIGSETDPIVLLILLLLVRHASKKPKAPSSQIESG